ncbi:hypothetical protein QR680_000390 [Steinernema hermaphroditum]|uniref:Uncharacterized protein n=1 Tax=Steinernema hermaphroditum TaxID=289476 RepID=A0AA39LDY6_9BILA|nr:hypothetical protein QR680_000390 [Steinernema hermaphroditum]
MRIPITILLVLVASFALSVGELAFSRPYRMKRQWGCGQCGGGMGMGMMPMWGVQSNNSYSASSSVSQSNSYSAFGSIMIEEIGYSVVVPVFLGIISYFAYRLYTSGLFDELKISVVESVPHLSKPVTVYYKHHVGPYSGVKQLFDEVNQLVPKGAKSFGLYYDDPRDTKEELCQSAIGVVFGEDGKDFYEDNYANQLNRWGYERMVLPAVQRAVVARQRYNGFMSLLVMVYKSYKAVAQFIMDNRLETGLSIEVYSHDEKGKCVVDLIFPLDHMNEFFVQEHMTTEALESKLARQHFDSDLSESESEPEGEEEADEEEQQEAGADEKSDE